MAALLTKVLEHGRKNFDQALAALVNDLKNVAGQPAARAGFN